VFGRTLFPESKYKTWLGKDQFFFDVTSSEKWNETYSALDELDKKSDTIQGRMNLRISKSIGRNTEVCFYDVTNYYFEIGQNDEDLLDGDGKLLQKGLRKKGVSKEKRPQPIVQMGLFIDDNGIPIAYKLFPGNEIDQTTLRPALKKNIDKLNFGKVIIVADGGLNSDKNIAHILKTGNGYIVSKSTKKSTKEVKKWILEEDGYAWNKDKTFKVKSKNRERVIKDEDGNTQKIKEKLVCYWSKKHYDREVKENEKFMRYLDSVIANPDKLKDKPKKIEKFLAKTAVVKETGEILDANTRLSLDMTKINEYKELMGYYTIQTSETEKTDQEIINKYHGLSRIEDSFRIVKSDLEGRPVFVRTLEHINAHFLVCFSALTMIRIIQYKILKYQGKDTLNENGWESGLSAARIKEALTSFMADALPQGYYRLTEITEDLKLILTSLGVSLAPGLWDGKNLRLLKHTIDNALLCD
jgi:transposase